MSVLQIGSAYRKHKNRNLDHDFLTNTRAGMLKTDIWCHQKQEMFYVMYERNWVSFKYSLEQFAYIL